MKNEIYEIMHKDRKVAWVDGSGRCKIYYKSFMPYALYFKEQNDTDSRSNNIARFYHWCAGRFLAPGRKYVEEILYSAGLDGVEENPPGKNRGEVDVTELDRKEKNGTNPDFTGADMVRKNLERAKIALTYHCASLTDVFWVRCAGEKLSFAEINLYDNYLEQSCIDIALKGHQYSTQNKYLARDLATGGSFPKAWQRKDGGFRLLKGGGEDTVERELLASRICRCFNVSQILYEEEYFDGEKVAVSYNMTSKGYSIAALGVFEIYSRNHGRDTRQCVLELDGYNYHMMNIMDYLLGNTGRSKGDWGVFIDNSNNKPICLHKLMDFNQAFHAYDTMEGADCQTVFGQHMTQREAALWSVGEIGLNQIREVEKALFVYLPECYEMFMDRLSLLKQEEKRKRKWNASFC